MRIITALAAMFAATFAAGPALAACPPPAQMQAAATGWLAGDRLPDPGVASMADAACAYAAFRGGLEAAMGKRWGSRSASPRSPCRKGSG